MRKKNKVSVVADVFSPRWQSDDRYTIILSMSELIINRLGREVRFTIDKEKGPLWDAEKFLELMNKDGIYPPCNFGELLIYAWISWRDGDLKKAEVERQIKSLFLWLNKISKNKPKTKFWKAYF